MTRVHFLWQGRNPWRDLSTGVALHGHTQISRENLAFIPAYLQTIPFIGPALRKFNEAYRHRHGYELDLTALWWTPPLPPGEVFRIETRQLEQDLGLNPLISVTDHDDIAACRVIQLLRADQSTPISLEWTVPLGPSFVHLGIHNLPASRADSMFHALRTYTAEPSDRRLRELLAWLGEDPGTLVVLNHPLWDEAHLAEGVHESLVRELLHRHAGQIHAIELNGLRPWPENLAALALARATELPAVSGGDRHASEPSACLNLTRATSFAAFAAEIRGKKVSHILFLPRYADGHRMRQMSESWDLIRDYPEYPGRVRWTDRTYIRDQQGVSRSLLPSGPLGNRSQPAPVTRVFAFSAISESGRRSVWQWLDASSERYNR